MDKHQHTWTLVKLRKKFWDTVVSCDCKNKFHCPECLKNMADIIQIGKDEKLPDNDMEILIKGMHNLLSYYFVSHR